MVPLVLLLLVAVAVGFTAWAVDSRRHAYGVLLLPGIAVAAAVLLWFILMAAGPGFRARRPLPDMAAADGGICSGCVGRRW